MSEPTTPTYWELAWSDFRRSRLALAGTAVILGIVVVALLCPLLANHRPLYLRAVLTDDFENELAVAIEKTEALAKKPDLTREERETLRHGALERLANLREHLADGTGSAALSTQLEGAKTPAEFKAVADALDGLFDAKLHPVVRYPAVRGLETPEVFALLLLPFGIVALAFRRTGIPQRLAAVLLLASLSTYAWKSAYPTISDPRPYRQMISAPTFATAGGIAFRPLIPYGENENLMRDARQAPSWFLPSPQRPPLREWHWLGTDTNGRDVLARMIYGARVSMLVGVLSVAIYTAIGIVLGAVAGYFGGMTDMALSRLVEVVICFPPLMVILAVQASLPPSLFNIVLALAALWWTGVARLQRAEFLRLVNLDYVVAVRALGGSHLRIIFRHILPNGLGPILVMVSFGIAGSIVIESALSFLGFGVPQPMASWGDLLNNGRNDIQGTWWLTVFPGCAIFLTVTCFNLVGEALRDALDPRRGD